MKEVVMMSGEKKVRKQPDPKEKIRILKEDIGKKSAALAAAQEKLKEEESRQLDKSVKELLSLCRKTGAEICDVIELMRRYAEQGISPKDEINRLRGGQTEFESASEKDDTVIAFFDNDDKADRTVTV